MKVRFQVAGKYSSSLIAQKLCAHKAIRISKGWPIFILHFCCMQKNLLEKDCAASVISRVQKLQPDSIPRWGKMTVTEMLHHCNLVHQQLLLPATPHQKKTSLRQYLIRWVVLYAMPRYPKNAQAPKRFHTKGVVDKARFADEKQAFIELVQRLAGHSQPIHHWHPYFGNLSTEQWGRTSWKHVDHHLRQFGV